MVLELGLRFDSGEPQLKEKGALKELIGLNG